MELRGKKFAASFSGGKDCTLAIYRAMNEGLIPHCLFTTFNKDRELSWFHGIPPRILDEISCSLSIPVRLIETTGAEYQENFEAALRDFRTQGAEVCVFGDIDLQAHQDWCSARCESAGLIPFFPLWKESRKKLVYEFIDAGFKTMITVVDTERMPGDFAGKTLSREVADEIEACGADICGENGEYHTFVYDGPIFKNSIPFETEDPITHGKHRIIGLK